MGFAASPASLCPTERGHALLWAESPPQQRLVCSKTASSPGQPPRKVLLFSCTVLLSTGRFLVHTHGPFLPTTTTPSGGSGIFADVAVGFLPLSLRSVEASHGRRRPELPVSSCDPHPSQPHSSAALHLLRGLCSRQLHFPGRLQRCCEYLLPPAGAPGSAPSWGLSCWTALGGECSVLVLPRWTRWFSCCWGCWGGVGYCWLCRARQLQFQVHPQLSDCWWMFPFPAVLWLWSTSRFGVLKQCGAARSKAEPQQCCCPWESSPVSLGCEWAWGHRARARQCTGVQVIVIFHLYTTPSSH